MKRFLVLALTVLVVGCRSTEAPETVTTQNQSEDWISLFNGTDLEGWTIKMAGQPLDSNYRNTFRVEDSMLRISYADYDSFDDAYGHLYYDRPYSRYKLRFDYRFTGEQTPGGADWNVRNSGVMLHAQSARSNDYGQHFPVSIELQLLGGLGDGDRTTGNVCTPGTAVVMGDTVNYNHCIPSSSATFDGDGWVSAEAVVLGGEAMYFLIEGDTVLQFFRPQIGGGFIYRDSLHRDWTSAGIVDSRDAWLDRAGEILTEGYIALQAESHPIDFRNIRLLNLE